MRDKIDIIELKATILEDNDADATLLRQELKDRKICLINVMSSPGSGKTSTLLALKPYLDGKIKWGVMEADIDSDVDASVLIDAGIPAVQLHTGGMCHLDADMTRQGIRAFEKNIKENKGEGQIDLIVLENIGNLVCPAEYETGASLNLTILSVPEGDDKPAKYPLMYEKSDILVINKIDALPVFDFDKSFVEMNIKKLNPNMKIFYISAKTGEGVNALAEELLKVTDEWKQ